MKKLLGLLLAMLLLCGVALAEDADYVGTWNLVGAEMNGAPIDLTVLKLEMSMELRDDHTCTLTNMGVPEEGTWALDDAGVAVTDSTAVVQNFVLVNGKLEGARENMKIIFARKADAAAYADTWVLTRMEVMGQKVDAISAGQEMIVVLLETGECVVVVSENGEEIQDQGVWSETEDGVVLTDGEDPLYLSYDAAEDVMFMEQSGGRMVLTRFDKSALSPVGGLTLADFEGTWNMHSVVSQSLIFTPETAGTDICIQMKEGKGYVKETVSGETFEYFGVCELQEYPEYNMTALYLMLVDETGAQNGSGLELYLFNNGQLVWIAMYGDGSENWYYFDRAE